MPCTMLRPKLAGRLRGQEPKPPASDSSPPSVGLQLHGGAFGALWVRGLPGGRVFGSQPISRTDRARSAQIGYRRATDLVRITCGEGYGQKSHEARICRSFSLRGLRRRRCGLFGRRRRRRRPSPAPAPTPSRRHRHHRRAPQHPGPARVVSTSARSPTNNPRAAAGDDQQHRHCPAECFGDHLQRAGGSECVLSRGRRRQALRIGDADHRRRATRARCRCSSRRRRLARSRRRCRSRRTRRTHRRFAADLRHVGAGPDVVTVRINQLDNDLPRQMQVTAYVSVTDQGGFTVLGLLAANS